MRENTFNPKTKQKGKGKAHSEHKKEGNSKPFDDSSGSKGGKGKKGKSKCGYCNHDYHPKSTCMKKQNRSHGEGTSTEQSGGHIPKNAKKKSGDQPPDKRGNSHALIAIHSSLDAWILDSGIPSYGSLRKCFIFYYCMHGSSHPHGR
jgi:hypothetical protein